MRMNRRRYKLVWKTGTGFSDIVLAVVQFLTSERVPASQRLVTVTASLMPATVAPSLARPSPRLSRQIMQPSGRTLEIINRFTSISVEPAKDFDIFFGNKHNMRHQKLASGLALIGASSPNAKIVLLK